MMNNFVELTEKYIKKHDMIREGDVVVAGVSGGADSVCLLFVLCALREDLGFNVKVCHVNHGIRGAEADADERFVQELCGRFGVECKVFHENVELIAAKRKQSVEEAGRFVRREAFERMCAGEMHAKIATAHHLNDNAETVLLNIARGTGVRGLCGIWPVRGNWIRPLVWAGRDEIEHFLREQRIRWCEDATNEEDEYTRNRIRHHVMPVLETQINSCAAAHLTELSAQARELWDLVEREVGAALLRCMGNDADGKTFLDKEALKEEHVAVQKQLVKQCIAQILGTEKDITSVHVREVLELFDKQNGRMLDLPGGIRAVRTYKGVEISRKKKDEVDIEEAGMQLTVDSDIRIPGCGMRISCRLIECNGKEIPRDIPQKNYTKWLDYDIIKNGLSLRKRRPGDYLRIDKKGNKQKLKSYFVNQKVPREEREKMWLIADGPEIVWIPEYRMNCAYYVKDSTERILEIKITEDGANVRDNQRIDFGRES